MKLLLDTCIALTAVESLRDRGHDVVWSGDWESDPGDEEILAIAFAEDRVLVTLDKDFGELAIIFEHPHCGIVRIANFRASQQAQVIQQIIERHELELSDHAIITAEPGRIRIRTDADANDTTTDN